MMTESQSSNPAKLTALPGFNLPLNLVPKQGHPDYIGSPFPNALDEVDVWDGSIGLPLTTLREFTMLQLMNEITDKVNWHKKVFDEEIVSKWKAEALAAEGKDITQRMVDWCIDELRYKAKLFEETGAIIVYNGDVVKSDTIIPLSVMGALQAAVKPLEDIPARMKDWHPDSDEKVLDLVHPSLFPLVYGLSRILPNGVTNLEDCIERCGEGEVVPVPPENETMLAPGLGPGRFWRLHLENPYSRKFQWLPCEVDISGKRAEIKSYVNNLHPQKHANLYEVISQIITHAIPLWNITLSPLADSHGFFQRVEYDGCEYDPDPESWPESDRLQQEEDEDEDDYLERLDEWYSTTRRVVLPEPDTFVPPTEYTKVDLKGKYGRKGLQVIVKLANIELSPEKPEYGGGTWHVEGQLNERICATALYYYSNENITPSSLAFRQQCGENATENISYEQDHHDWLPVVFGCEQDGPAVQTIGSVATPEGRLLTFPNILQHQVQPFKLADPTRPGHRKLLALFLVDPNIRVISTANVPCQQRAWWSETVSASTPAGNALANLPFELRNQIFEDVDGFPISLDEAKRLRLELMAERKKFVLGQGDAFQSNVISLCEH